MGSTADCLVVRVALTLFLWSREKPIRTQRLAVSVANSLTGTPIWSDTWMRITWERRPHKYPFCRKAFTQRSNLIVHVRIHTGEKPYFCKSCGRMVPYSYHLKTCSMREANGEKSFCCLVCGKKKSRCFKSAGPKEDPRSQQSPTLLNV